MNNEEAIEDLLRHHTGESTDMAIKMLEKDIDSGCNHAYSEDESAINVDNNNDIVCKICGCVFNRRGKIIDKATYIDFKYY